MTTTTVEITEVGPVAPWRADLAYLQNASVTPQDIDDPEVTLPQYWYICVVGGTSGATAPAWPNQAGVLVEDGEVTWLCYGLFPN